MNLIMNADDFGHSKGVNLGIIEAYQNGIVRTATIMAGMPAFDHAVMLAKQNPGLKIGAHLTLTCGKSVGEGYKTIADYDGNFLKLSRLTDIAKQIDLSEVEHEYEAQIKKILDSGIEIDHFDSHHHTHTLDGVFNVFLKLAVKYDKAVRVFNKSDLQGEFSGLRAPDRFIYTFFDGLATNEHLIEILEQNRHGSIEVMCHPAYLDQTLLHSSSYNIQRTVELSVLTGDTIKQYIDSNNIQLSSFSDL